MDNKFIMSLSLNVLNHLGINLYSNIPAVLSEIVANSWDADAVYKPTVVFNKKEKQLLLWFNGRKKNSEKIGMASYMV